MKNRLKNNKAGSTLVWAIVILLVVSIVVTAVLTISLSYTNRSIDNNAKRQAYFTARSVVDAIGDEICGDTSNGNVLLEKLEDASSIDLNDFTFEAASSAVDAMGSCKATLTKSDDGDNITITATATVGTQTDTVVLLLRQNKGYGFQGLVANQVDITGSLTTAKGNDIYTMGTLRTALNGVLRLDGSLYSHPKIDMNFGSGSKVTGDIISDRSILLLGSYGSAEITGQVYSQSQIDLLDVTVPEGKLFENQPTSKIPKITKPELPELPDEGVEMLEAADKDKELGEPNRDKFYQISESMNLGELKTVENAGSIFIYVEDGAVVTTDAMEERTDLKKTPPNFYFILGKGSQLVCVKSEVNFYGYIFNETTSLATDVNFVTMRTNFCGGIYADKFSHTGELNFISMDSSGNPGAKGKWSPVQYLKDGEAAP